MPLTSLTSQGRSFVPLSAGTPLTSMFAPSTDVFAPTPSIHAPSAAQLPSVPHEWKSKWPIVVAPKPKRSKASRALSRPS